MHCVFIDGTPVGGGAANTTVIGDEIFPKLHEGSAAYVGFEVNFIEESFNETLKKKSEDGALKRWYPHAVPVVGNEVAVGNSLFDVFIVSNDGPFNLLVDDSIEWKEIGCETSTVNIVKIPSNLEGIINSVVGMLETGGAVWSFKEKGAREIGVHCSIGV
ncbi:hypothetical protein F3Y22_tig00110174pilonHSYRG00173 [Hibiscus syriacus]|uniref:Uncharacterized protein n=1 Tax=Hibiscus syriacus TaxID=106335 RepID=A0A6A3BKL3_HIBSY|nr:hypothetical protein F3Y22_tig00110174pilonHSYRG00173 [Hibiscus syriacus]